MTLNNAYLVVGKKGEIPQDQGQKPLKLWNKIYEY